MQRKNNNKERNKEIYRLKQQGLSFAVIGEKYNLSSCRVSTICKNEEILESRRNNDELWQLICSPDETYLQVGVYKSLRRTKIDTVNDLRKHIDDIISGKRPVRGINKKGKTCLRAVKKGLKRKV